MKNRRANAVLFGFDFQVNAAIILMLENITELSSLRLEGNFEDIELCLEDGQYIFAQAKAIENSSSDFHNVRHRLGEALETLSEAYSKTNAKELILITNSPNPLNEKASMNLFSLDAHRPYDSLPQTSKQLIDKYLNKLPTPLDKHKFLIQILPFETDIDDERYKFVRRKIDDFVGELNLNIMGLSKQLMTIWHEDIFKSGSKKDAAIVLKKKDIVWPVVILATSIDRFDEDLREHFEIGMYDEIVHKYHDLINSCCERCDFFIKALYDYNDYNTHENVPREKAWKFAEDKWKYYESEFEIVGVDNETKKFVIQIILYSIVRNRISIDKIKRGVNL